MVSYGSGAGSDAFDITVTGRISEAVPRAPTVREYINRRTEIDYALYARFRGKIRLE